MSQKILTGGDGSTGQTGLQSREVINDNFTELYLATSDAFSRAYTEELLFDKKEIFYAPHVQDDDIVFSLASSGHLVNESSSARMTVAFDGIHTISVGSEFTELIGFNNGDIIPSGTYKVYFLYVNGEVSVNIPGASSQSSGLQRLSTPGSFAAVADGENAIDLSWTDISDEVEYQIEKSITGTGGWVLLANPAAGSTSYSDTGLLPGDSFYYRIKAVGDGVAYNDSLYATDSATTENSGDTDAPVPTFTPANSDTSWTVNRPITIDFDEYIRKSDGTELINNTVGIIVLKEDNSGGADIPHSWTINSGKNQIIITPTTHYGAAQVVYVAVQNVEDTSGNEMSLTSISFTTTDWTYFNGTTNRLQFGDLLDSVWAVADTNFWLALTIRNQSLTGQRVFIAKADYSGNQRSFVFYQNGTDIYFNYYKLGTTAAVVIIKWTNVLTSGEHDLVLKYNGALDTNNGLDRAVLEIDGVVQGSKSLETGTNPTPGDIFNGTAQLSVGVSVTGVGVPSSSQFFTGEAKDFIVTTASGVTVQINVPLLADGQDVSGNARHGTWV